MTARRLRLALALLLACALPILLLVASGGRLAGDLKESLPRNEALVPLFYAVSALALPGLAAASLVVSAERSLRLLIFLSTLLNTAFWWVVLTGVASAWARFRRTRVLRA